MMNIFTRSMNQVFKNAYESFQAFPISIASAFAFAVVTMIRIQLDWPEQEAYNFLFNCLHWSFALGSILGLTALTATKSRYNTKCSFLWGNGITLLTIGCTLMILYLWGGADLGERTVRYETLTILTMNRLSVAMSVSLLSFLLLARDKLNFAGSLFMTLKGFVIALIYGLVMMVGASIVASAVENLIYDNMSEKVYMYIATIAGFLAFTIFVGYFPDFRKGVEDGRRQQVEKQPQFIEVLLGYILIPIMLALTFVLFLWSGRTIITGDWPHFVELSSIATTYAIGGILLHILVTHQHTGLSDFYKRYYPMAALIILIFQAWALVVQLAEFGMKTTEYAFALLWIVTVASAIALVWKKEKAHLFIVMLICFISIVSVLPGVGYHVLPVKAQIDRLQNLLTEHGILQDDQLKPVEGELERSVREHITDAVQFLAYAEDAKLPVWFPEDLADHDVFKKELGFEMTWPEEEFRGGPSDYRGMNLTLPSDAIAIKDYDWAVSLLDQYRENQTVAILDTDKGHYEFYWISDQPDNVPRLKIVLNDNVILEADMNDYLDELMDRYPLNSSSDIEATLDDMCVNFKNPEIEVLVVFRDISIQVDPQNDRIYYWLNPHSIYFHE